MDSRRDAEAQSVLSIFNGCTVTLMNRLQIIRPRGFMTGVSLLIALKHSDVTQVRIFLPSAPLRDILLLLQRVRV